MANDCSSPATISASGRRLQNPQRDGFGEHHDQQRAAPVRDLGRGLHLVHDAEEVGRLHDDRGGVVVDLAFQVFEIDACRYPARSRTPPPACPGCGRRCAAPRDTRDARCARPARVALPVSARRHHGRLGHGGGAVVHGGVGHVHAGELADHGLEFEDRGERALRDLGLVGRVGSEKLAARNHRIHQHRAVMVVHAGAQERGVAVGVFGAARAEVVDDFVFGDARRQVQRAAAAAPLRAGARTGLRRTRRRRRPASRGVRNRTSEDSATTFRLLCRS